MNWKLVAQIIATIIVRGAMPLTILLMVLRATNIVHFSWFWVLFPLFVPAGLIIISCIILLVGAYIAVGRERWKQRRTDPFRMG